MGEARRRRRAGNPAFDPEQRLRDYRLGNDGILEEAMQRQRAYLRMHGFHNLDHYWMCRARAESPLRPAHPTLN